MKSLHFRFGHGIFTAFKWQGLKVGMPVFQLFYGMKLKTSKFKKSWHFEASEAIMTKFKSQALHVIRIKYWKAGGTGNPPSLIPALWNIGILLHKQATRTFWRPVYVSAKIRGWGDRPPAVLVPLALGRSTTQLAIGLWTTELTSWPYER